MSIIVKIKGGLGNQLFQYAYGYSIARKNNSKLFLDLDWFRREKEDTKGPGLTSRDLDIFNFKIDYRDESPRKRSFYKFSFLNKIKNKIFPEVRRPYQKERDLGFDPKFLNVKGNVYLEGFWQTPLYFKDVKEDIKRQFVISYQLSERGRKWVGMIQSSFSVAIHIRRGDYVNQKAVNKRHGVPSITYYEEAMEYFNELKSPVSFFVFTDDWEWVKENLKLAENIFFVDNMETATDDLHLMSLCKNQIIANSTFSWWGAWLNNHPEKIVIAPKIWYADVNMNNQVKTLIPKNWLRF